MNFILSYFLSPTEIVYREHQLLHFECWLNAVDVRQQIDGIKIEDDAKEAMALIKMANGLENIDKLEAADIDGMIKEANKQESKADHRRRKQVSTKVRNWVSKICSGHMKEAHAAIKRKENLRPDTEEMQVEGKTAEDLKDVMDIKGTRWASLWHETDAEERKKLKEDIEEIRTLARAQENETGAITGEMVSNASYHLKNSRGLGTDRWQPLEWQEMPKKAAEALASILNQMEEKVTVPIQIMLNIIALIPKPQGGDRPICLASLLYVLYTAIRGDHMKDWDQGRVAHWDDAVKSSSAL